MPEDGGMTLSPQPSEDEPAGEDAALRAPPSTLPISPKPGIPRTEGTAVAALVLAILSWFVLPIIGSIVALVLAASAERSIDARPAELAGRGLVTGARYVAWTHLVVAAMIIAFLAAFVIAVWIGQ